MPIPTLQTLMLPVLRHCEEKGWVMRDLVARIADDLGLTQQERERRIPSGTVIASRVHWPRPPLSVIHKDQLGLDRVYLQAKRYAPGNTIGRL